MNKKLKAVISLAAGCVMVLSSACASAETGEKKEQNMETESVNVYKTIEQHNPVMVQRFGADPWAMVYNGRVYLYMTGDEPVTKNGSKPKTNDYANIVTIRILSSDDLVNWTDHGSVCAAAPQDGL